MACFLFTWMMLSFDGPNVDTDYTQTGSAGGRALTLRFWVSSVVRISE